VFSGLRSRLTYANVVATLALFLALPGGTAGVRGGRVNHLRDLPTWTLCFWLTGAGAAFVSYAYHLPPF
jgi:hypothetical protein